MENFQVTQETALQVWNELPEHERMKLCKKHTNNRDHSDVNEAEILTIMQRQFARSLAFIDKFHVELSDHKEEATQPKKSTHTKVDVTKTATAKKTAAKKK